MQKQEFERPNQWHDLSGAFQTWLRRFLGSTTGNSKTKDQLGHFDMDGTSFDQQLGVIVASSKKSGNGEKIQI